MEEYLEKIIEKVLRKVLPDMQKKQWITREDIKEEYGIGIRTIQQWEADGLKYVDSLPHLYHRNDVNEFLHEKKLNKTSSRRRDRLR